MYACHFIGIEENIEIVEISGNVVREGMFPLNNNYYLLPTNN